MFNTILKGAALAVGGVVATKIFDEVVELFDDKCEKKDCQDEDSDDDN